MSDTTEPKREPLLSDDEMAIWVGDNSLFMPDHDEGGVELSNGGIARRPYSRFKDQCEPEVMDADTAYFRGFQHGRDFYESKITSGELMVVKTAKNIAADAPLSFVCGNCHASNGSGAGRMSFTGFPYKTPMKYCFNCAAKITEG